jgi:hypothetical protein
MPRLKKLLTYTPPDFKLFQEPDHGYPRGLLYEAWMSLRFAWGGYLRGQEEYIKGDKSFAKWPSRIRGCDEDDLITMYADLAKADDMLSRLEAMKPEERKKHLELDNRYDYEKAAGDFAKLWGRIAAWELEGGALYEEVLNGLLKRRIDEWEYKFLPKAAETEFAFEYGDELETVNDYCDERSTLEYAATAIRLLRLSGYETDNRERLASLPFFDTYVKRLKASDATFRKLLKGRRDIEAWADPTFWWHWPADQDSGKKKPRKPKS